MAFTGFRQDALDFFSEIRLNNNQTFYEANKERYEREIKAPLRALCEEMAPVIALIDPRLDTRPGSAMSRIRRDTRFTKDKSPFRDHCWLGWRYPGERRSEGFGMYWGFGADWLGWGCGSYAADKPLMDALRLEIRRNPDEVLKIMESDGLRGRYVIYGEDYKKLVVPDDVPEALRGLYRKRGFGIDAITTAEDWKLLSSHAMADRLAAELAAMAPLVQLMQRMRREAEHAQQETARELEAERRAEAQRVEQPDKGLTVRSREEFEF